MLVKNKKPDCPMPILTRCTCLNVHPPTTHPVPSSQALHDMTPVLHSRCAWYCPTPGNLLKLHHFISKFGQYLGYLDIRWCWSVWNTDHMDSLEKLALQKKISICYINVFKELRCWWGKLEIRLSEWKTNRSPWPQLVTGFAIRRSSSSASCFVKSQGAKLQIPPKSGKIVVVKDPVDGWCIVAPLVSAAFGGWFYRGDLWYDIFCSMWMTWDGCSPRCFSANWRCSSKPPKLSASAPFPPGKKIGTLLMLRCYISGFPQMVGLTQQTHGGFRTKIIKTRVWNGGTSTTI